MSLLEEARRLKKQIEEAKTKGKERSLPSGSLFLDDGVCAFPSSVSLTRFPYTRDGLALWALQNGKMSMNESDFFYLPENIDGEPNFLALTLGIKKEDGYLPYALFDINRNILEGKAKRYTVYKDGYCLYFLEVDSLLFVCRFGISKEKELLIEGAVASNASESKELYTSLYLNPMLMHGCGSSIETKWFKQCDYQDHRYVFSTVEDLSRTVHLHAKATLFSPLPEGAEESITTSRALYCGGKNNPFSEATPLLKGGFEKEKPITRFSDTAIAGDFRRFALKPGESFSFGYSFGLNPVHQDLKAIQKAFGELEKDNAFSEMDPRFVFHFEGEGGEKASRFFSMLTKQVHYCATCKNSTLLMLGVRDIYQAIEAQVPFAPKLARAKILDCLNYLEPGGRSPRQFAHFEPRRDEIRVDSREFIDQGLWIIRCVYTYLSYTGDYSLLKEEAGFLEIHGASATKLPLRSSVLDHLERILGYLISHIDPKTHCLRTLYGDWNDAIDGLGKGDDENSFGDGVSSMATFQLYEAIGLFKEIAEHEGLVSPLPLEKKKEELEQGILAHIIVHQGEKTRILHGWGKNASFEVGSFSDVDKEDRYALTSNAFYCLSGFDENHPEFAPAVKEAFSHLEGKYGFLTFSKPFGPNAREVGRIVNLPAGTAENAATYIHGALFAVDALFQLNEPEWAYKEIHKLLPYEHDFISTTPFVMPNSYLYAPPIDCDGESMSDWFTGSSSTLLKLFLKDVFGLDVHLDSISFCPPSLLPFPKLSLTVSIEGKPVHLKLKEGTQASLVLNGVSQEGHLDPFGRVIYPVAKSSLTDSNTLMITAAMPKKGE